MSLNCGAEDTLGCVCGRCVKPHPNKTNREEVVRNAINKVVDNKVRIANIDAEINGGALVEVGMIIGKSLLIRVNLNDPELAKHEVEMIRTILGNQFNPPIIEHEKLTTAEYAIKHRISVVTVRRWIKSGKLKAYKFGKSYRIKSETTS